MIRSVLWALALAGAAEAETARVLSGEHGGFTRLVVELPGAEGWTLRRTPGGYAFGTEAEVQPDYDLALVWQRISRSRIKDLAVDPASGVLSLALGCDCHILPFEYRTGIIVLDVKDGPAPADSDFEAPFQPSSASSGLASSDPAQGYDWVDEAKAGARRVIPALPMPLDTGSVSLDPLRDELLAQLAKGAVDGIVDMELPSRRRKIPADSTAAAPDLPWAAIRIGEQPGVVVTRPGALIEEKTPDKACAPDGQLDLAAWGADRAASDILAHARSNLYGEFDVPDREAVLRSVQELLFLGFGAEARLHLGFLEPAEGDATVLLYQAMSRIVDGERAPNTDLAGMLACDGPAALWAALARDRLPPGPETNRAAILQAYQALPAHLRRHLGPALADRFLGLDDAEAARIIRDAVERSTESDAASVALLDARAKLQAGDADAARIHAEAAVSLDGDRAEHLIALVEAHFRKLQPIDRGVPEALLALRGEVDATDLGPAVQRAIVLSLALSDQVEDAFSEPVVAGAMMDELWRVVEARASDDEFLRHAVLFSETALPEVTTEVAQGVAGRLLALGFADAALIWLGPVGASDAPDIRLMAASSALRGGDARQAVALLNGLEGAEVEELRAEALVQLGDLPAAIDALVAAGNADAAARLGLWTADWPTFDQDAPDPWRKAADLARPPPVFEATGLLGRGSQSVEASLASRDAIRALLDAVPAPSETGLQ